MTTIEQTQRVQIEVAAARPQSGAAGLFDGFVAALSVRLRGLGELRVGAGVNAPQIISGVTSELFARAVSENSSSATGWLGYASQLSDAAERSFCIGKALQLAPDCPVVRAEARRLR